MDELISALLEIVGGVTWGFMKTLATRYMGCFVALAAIILSFWLFIGGLIGAAIVHPTVLGWLLGGSLGAMIGVLIVWRLGRNRGGYRFSNRPL